MSDIETRIAALEADVKRLTETRAIEALRYRYWYAISRLSVDDLVACFADDAFLEYGFGIELKGKPAIRDFFTHVMGDENLIKQIPRGANPDIRVLSDTQAEGTWLVEVVTQRRAEGAGDLGVGTRISLRYDESYVKTDEGWRIVHMKNDYLLFEELALKTSP